MSERKTAGAFDIRNVIGALLALYGVILLLTAAFHSGAPKGTHNSDNWWGGAVLLVVGVVFMAWARLRPIVVKERPSSPER
ncbi:hypothetical protein [Nocardioides sp.]|jgi:hypothetical protein|uniref:hypothetical protein n=1 Tax=Nocardioides sp. TaxID=35761 RepID=UPI002C9FF4C9|nr:hypothetical protein [Nocardioides sp.]HVX53014.1 hypothetical protein [Nocardioides sp.]